MATVPVILAPVDGSEQSMNTIAYLGRTISSRNVAIILFHVMSETPEPFFDMGETQEATAFQTEIGKWKSSRSTSISRFMEEAKRILVLNGFAAGSISTTIQQRRDGISRDIISKSRNGYAGIIVGRKGFGTLPDYMLGSITAKLADAIEQIPIFDTFTSPQRRSWPSWDWRLNLWTPHRRGHRTDLRANQGAVPRRILHR